MFNKHFFKKIKRSTILIPLLIVLFSCSFLIIANYYTIRTLSACGSYINADSHYSKAHRDATRHLIIYLYSEDKNEWLLFNEQMKIPAGDKMARIALKNNGPNEMIEKGFIAGNNDPQDISDLIWLYRNFRSLSFFKKAITIWENSDKLVNDLVTVGNDVHEQINTKTLSNEEKAVLLYNISIVSNEFTTKGFKFSETLNDGTRDAKNNLLILNILLTLILIGSLSYYYLQLFNKLIRAKRKSDEMNNELILANKELDKFVYSASHDLRSPISSLKGLIAIMRDEQDLEQIKSYLTLMDGNLDKQDQFIRDIIDYSRNKKAEINRENVSLKAVVETSISQNKFLQESKGIKVYTNLSIDTIYSNALKLNIIINNLYTNGLKYYDNTKENPSIAINAYEEDNSYILVIEDNGIGIKTELHVKIFEMFFVANAEGKSSGLGLYLVKDATDKLGGTIHIKSKVNIGTQFIIYLPKSHNDTL